MHFNNKMECFSYKGGDGIRVLSHLKEELAGTTEKWLQAIIFLQRVITEELKNKAVLSFKQYCVHYYLVT